MPRQIRTSPTGAAHQPSSATRTFSRAAGGRSNSRLALTTPRVKSSTWTRPKVSREDPAIMSPAASSAIAVTMQGAGQQDRQRREQRPQRALDQAEVRGGEDEAGDDERRHHRQQRRQQAEALREAEQPDHHHRGEGGEGDVAPAGLEDQRDAGGRGDPAQVRQPDGVARAAGRAARAAAPPPAPRRRARAAGPAGSRAPARPGPAAGRPVTASYVDGAPLASDSMTPVGPAAIWASGWPRARATSASSSSTSLIGWPVATIAVPRCTSSVRTSCASCSSVGVTATPSHRRGHRLADSLAELSDRSA